MIHPQQFLMLGWQSVDAVAARIVPAAFMAIGGVFSLAQRILECIAITTAKIICSSMALVAILLATGGDELGRGLVLPFSFFLTVFGLLLLQNAPRQVK